LREKFLKSLYISLAANGVSTIIGMALIPIMGLVWEIILLQIEFKLKIDTGHILHWIWAYILAVFINTYVEVLVVKLFFFEKNSGKYFGGCLPPMQLQSAYAP